MKKKMAVLIAAAFITAMVVSASHCMAAGTTTQSSRPVTTREANGMESLFRLLESDNATVEQFSSVLMTLTGHTLDEVFDTLQQVKDVKLTWFELEKGKKETPLAETRDHGMHIRCFGVYEGSTIEAGGKIYNTPDHAFRDDEMMGESGVKKKVVLENITEPVVKKRVDEGMYELFKLRLEGNLADMPPWINRLLPALSKYVAGRKFVYFPIQLRAWSDNVTYSTMAMRKVRLSLSPDGRFAVESDTFLPFVVGGTNDKVVLAEARKRITKDCRRYNLIWRPSESTNFEFELIPSRKGVQK